MRYSAMSCVGAVNRIVVKFQQVSQPNGYIRDQSFQMIRIIKTLNRDSFYMKIYVVFSILSDQHDHVLGRHLFGVGLSLHISYPIFYSFILTL